MPDRPGVWRYETRSNRRELDGKSGSFECVAPSPGNRGPVRVRNTFHFGHEDGSPYFPFGTTCYVWTHQPEELQERTLATLKASPFNMVRMCVFPKHYDFNRKEPPRHPFLKGEGGKPDFTRFNPEFFRHFERRVGDLRALGIEADVILFHPYDRFWVMVTSGGYAGHGETYWNPEEVLWWSPGGTLRGESPPRIAFLPKIVEEGPPEGTG